MRKALIVGIDYYENVNSLSGCVNDAYNIKSVLQVHSDGTKNFGVKLLTATDARNKINRKSLKETIIELFKDPNEIALLYFSGHGYIDSYGGYLITSECSEGDDGLSMTDILTIANESPAESRIIILDCCHAGFMGKVTGGVNQSILSEGVTILTASSETQYALEENGSGVFTSLFVDAMHGGAANLLGDITPGSIYAHIDQSLGPWEQRPIFKTNVRNFTSLRSVQPPIAISDLRKLTDLFSDSGDEYPLDPSYEPDSGQPNDDNVEKFRVLQKFNRVNLVIPIDEEHMYYAAMNSKACKLTVLGAHYWNLLKKDRI